MSERADGLILITRPEPGAQQTLARLATLGWRGLCAPMLSIAPRRLGAPRRAQAVVVTSANAIPALPDALRTTPLFAVGDATAERARQAGFGRVSSAGKDAEALAALVAEQCHPEHGPLLLASGAGQGMPLAADLRGRGFTVLRRVAYAASPVSALPEAALSALRRGEVGVAMFFSPATARAFTACMVGNNRLVAGVEALAISPLTARALAPLPWRRIRVASHPNQDELVALLS